MPSVVIPHKTMKNADLVLVPKKEYEALLRLQKTFSKRAVVRRSQSFRIPKKQEKFYRGIDKELTAAFRDFHDGRYYGPFEVPSDAVKFLRRKQ